MDREIQRAVEIGEANKRVLELAQNWCAHLSVEQRGGVGIVEQMTGLPIGMRAITCPHARAAGFAGMDLEYVALDFYDRNCVGCAERRPVRLPNLLELVESRERDRARRETTAAQAREAGDAALTERQRKRRDPRRGADEARLGIYDVIERLDQNPTPDDHRVLKEIATAAAEKFDAAIQEALFDIADAGGWSRTEAALDVLFVVKADPVRLGAAALRALARGEAIREAAAIVVESLRAEHRELVPDALPALINAAAPSRVPIGLSELPGDPAGILAVHRLFPDLVYEALRVVLASSAKDDRIDACEAILHIITIDAEIGLKLAPDLTKSLSLPDDMYNRGSAALAVAGVLALTMRLMPRETDVIVAEAMSAASEDVGSALLRVYTEVLRPEFGREPRLSTAADPIAFRRIVQGFLDRRADERLTEATHFLRDRAKYFPALVAAEAATLLGAAALIADDLKERYSPLLDPRPTAEKLLEAQTRQLRLSSALDAITEGLGTAMSHDPQGVVQQVLQALAGLGSSHPTLRAALMRGFAGLRRKPEAIPLLLPALYSAMTDLNQEVRAAAATVYGQLTDDLASDDLPMLLHETFLTLLRDPYVIVHQAAVRALRRTAIPAELHVQALGLVTAVFLASIKGDRDGRFLSDCIDKLIDLAGATQTLTPELVEQIVASLGRLRTGVAVEILRGTWGLRQARNFGDLVLRVLEDESLDDHDVDRLVDELRLLPDEELRRRASRLRDVAIRLCASSPHDVIDFIELLSRCEAWDETVQVARALAETAADTKFDRPRKLRFRALLAAAELEAAAAHGDHDAVITTAERWRSIAQEIRKDDEENAEARQPLRGLRLPPQDD